MGVKKKSLEWPNLSYSYLQSWENVAHYFLDAYIFLRAITSACCLFTHPEKFNMCADMYEFLYG